MSQRETFCLIRFIPQAVTVGKSPIMPDGASWRVSAEGCLWCFRYRSREKTGRELGGFHRGHGKHHADPGSCCSLAGGATYQVPMEVRPERRQTLGHLRWITKYSALVPEKTMRERLAEVRSWTLATIWAVLLRSARIPLDG